MDNQLQVKLNKHKLVTVCSTAENGGFSHLYPTFKYNGSSKSEDSKVHITFPMFSENLMFYEHFDQVHSSRPSRLSFAYLGGNAKGEVEYEFEDYSSVTVMDVANTFASVNSLFHVASKLPSCRELRIYLSDENILLSKEEKAISLRSVEGISRYISKSVKTLKIVQVGDIDPAIFNEMTRFEYLLIYAFKFFPNLENFMVEGMSGKGKIYNVVDEFIKSKPNLPAHSVTLRPDGKTVCQPVTVHHHHHRQAPLPRQAPPLYTSSTYPIRNQELKNHVSDTKTDVLKQQVLMMSPTRDPRLKRKIDVPKIHIENKEIIEVPVPPKPSPPLINITDEDENARNLPKKVKVEMVMENPVTKATMSSPSPSSTSSRSTPSRAFSSSRSSSSSGFSSIQANTRNNSLASIGSTYNDGWETSSNESSHSSVEADNGNDRIRGANPQVQVSAEQLTLLAPQIPMSEDYLRNVLNTAMSESPSVRESKSTASRPSTAPRKSGFRRKEVEKYITCKTENAVYDRRKRSHFSE